MIKPAAISLLTLILLAGCSDDFAEKPAQEVLPVVSHQSAVSHHKIIKKTVHKPQAKKQKKIARKPQIDSCKKIDRNIRKKSINKKPIQTMAATTTSFVVFFEPETVKITPASNAVLKGMLEKLAGISDYEVAIIDKSASRKTDAGLSHKRMELVKEQLIKTGIKEDLIRDGDEKAANNKIKHKVEVFLND